MYIPEGFVRQENKVCHLVKSLYGLCQSGRCWYRELDSKLREIGCENGNIDKCLYMFSDAGINTYLLVYVDDILIMGPDDETVENIKNKIKEKLEITEEEEIGKFLGIEIKWNEDGGRLFQEEYVKKCLEKYHMKKCKKQYTPMEERISFTSDGAIEADLESPIREAIGMLGHLANNTRPDIAFAVNRLAQQTCRPNREVWTGIKRVFRYLKGSENLGISIDDSNEIFHAYCDADWAADTSDRRSFSGYVIFLGSTPIVWKTRKQDCISTSTQEAEYIALSDCAKEVKALMNLVKDRQLFNGGEPRNVVIRCDNTSAISLAENKMVTAKSKHIETKYHFVKQLITNGDVAVEHVAGMENVADIFTKPLGRIKFTTFRDMLCNS
jgi:hypothetical protein